jgi:hypothetical protein
MIHDMITRFACISSVALALAACGGDDKGDTDTNQTTMVQPTMQTTDPDPTQGTTDSTTEPEPTTTANPSGEPVEGMFCIEECTADADCTINGADAGLKCEDGRCTGSAGGCTQDQECVAQFSGWAMACTGQDGCPGQVCIDIGGGEGRCASPPNDFLKCEDIGMAEIMMPVIEGGMEVAVCGNTDYECRDGACVNPCESDDECANIPGLPKCNVATGQCECSSDDDCTASGVDGLSVCKTTFCGCGSDEDCGSSPNADVCNDGVCGCSGDAACTTKVFDGTSIACK